MGKTPTKKNKKTGRKGHVYLYTMTELVEAKN
jgi:hypothetical protein